MFHVSKLTTRKARYSRSTIHVLYHLIFVIRDVFDGVSVDRSDLDRKRKHLLFEIAGTGRDRKYIGSSGQLKSQDPAREKMFGWQWGVDFFGYK